MIEKEITQAKQCALTTRDWDSFQVIVRTCLTPGKSQFTRPAAQDQTEFKSPEMDEKKRECSGRIE